MSASRRAAARLPQDASRILFVRNLPWRITSDDMYDIFGKFGAIRQIRLGEPTNKDTRGTAFVVFEDIFDAQAAVEHLHGFNVAKRYLVVLYYQPKKMQQRMELKKRQEELAAVREKYNLDNKD